MQAITKMVSGQPYRLDGYEEFILSATSSGSFTATLEGQVQANVDGAIQALEWVSLATITSGNPQSYDAKTPFIRVNIISGTPVFHLQRLEKTNNRPGGVIISQSGGGGGSTAQFELVNGAALTGYSGSAFTTIVQSGSAQGTWVRDDTATANGGTILAGAAPRVWRKLSGTGKYLNPYDFGCVGNGTTDDTAAMQLCFKTSELLPALIDGTVSGTFLVGPLTLGDPATASFRSGGGGNQGIGSPGFHGGSGKFAGFTLKARTTAEIYDLTDPLKRYILTRNNLAGTSIEGIAFDGNGVALLFDFSWVGTATGGVAPSNRNRIANIWTNNPITTALYPAAILDQCHDGINAGLDIRQGNVSLQGGGGMLSLKDSYFNGVLTLAAQNVQVSDCGLYGGIDLVGASFNQISFNNIQIINGGSRPYLINSTAIGNATRHVHIVASYFVMAAAQTSWIGGNYHSGIIIEGSTIEGSSIAQMLAELPIVNGARPVVHFKQCYLNQGLPSMSLATPWIAEDCTTGPAGLLRGIYTNAAWLLNAPYGSVTGNWIVGGTLQSLATNTGAVIATGAITAPTVATTSNISSVTRVSAAITAGKRVSLLTDGIEIASDADDARMWYKTKRFRLLAQAKNTWIRLTGVAGNHCGVMKIWVASDQPGSQAHWVLCKYQFNATPVITATVSSSVTGLLLDVRWRDPTLSGFNDPEINFVKAAETGTVDCTVYVEHLAAFG